MSAAKHSLAPAGEEAEQRDSTPASKVARTEDTASGSTAVSPQLASPPSVGGRGPRAAPSVLLAVQSATGVASEEFGSSGRDAAVAGLALPDGTPTLLLAMAPAAVGMLKHALTMPGVQPGCVLGVSGTAPAPTLPRDLFYFKNKYPRTLLFTPTSGAQVERDLPRVICTTVGGHVVMWDDGCFVLSSRAAVRLWLFARMCS